MESQTPAIEPAQDEDKKIDLRYYWAVIKKRLWMIIAVTVAVTTLQVVRAARKPKIYKAGATIIIDPQAPNVLGDQVEVVQLGSGNAWINEEYYNTQYRILLSLYMAKRVVETYPQLLNDPRVLPPTPGMKPDERLEAVAGAIQGRLRVGVGKDSRVFSIQVRDRDFKLCPELANYIAEVFINDNVLVKRGQTMEANRFVTKKLDEARKELDEAEKALIAYKEHNNILSVSLEDRQNLLSKGLETFSTALNDATRQRIELQGRRKAMAALIEGDPLSAPSSYFNNAPTAAALRETLLTEQQKLADIEDRYGEKMAQTATQRARVAALREALKSEGQSLLRALDAELRSVKDAEANYQAQLKTLTEDAFQVNAKEVDYKKLMRRAVTAEANYKQLLERSQQSGLQAQDYANNIRMLDRARPSSTPIAPNVQMSGITGLMMGLVLSFALAFGIEFLDRSVKTQEDIEQGARMTFLGIVPSLEAEAGPGKPELSIAKHPDSVVAESCRVLRTNIQFSSADKPLRTLVVTSSSPREGKTMTVVNLGIVMAQAGHRTLLVDTDMRRPRLHKALGVSNEDGVSRMVVGATDLERAVKSTEVPNLFLLPCGPIPPNPAELLQTEKFAALAKLLAEKFDRVIFDSPPVLSVTDAAVLSRVVDGTIFVVRAGRTTRDAVASARRAIVNVNPYIVGAVLNDVDLKSPHYQGYASYYKYRYREAPKVASASTDQNA